MEKYVCGSGTEFFLYELIKARDFQINGSAYCLDMHTKDARKAGETEQRLYALNAWRETPFYTEREQASLLPLLLMKVPQAVISIGITLYLLI